MPRPKTQLDGSLPYPGGTGGAPGPYTVVPSQAVFDRRLSWAAKGVLMALCSYANKYGARCFPNQATLAKQLGVSRPAISRQIKLLLQSGHLTYAPKPYRGLQGNCYRIVFDPTLSFEDVTATLTATDHEALRLPVEEKELLQEQNSSSYAKISLSSSFSSAQNCYTLSESQEEKKDKEKNGKNERHMDRLAITLPADVTHNKPVEEVQLPDPYRVNQLLQSWVKCTHEVCGYAPIPSRGDRQAATLFAQGAMEPRELQALVKRTARSRRGRGLEVPRYLAFYLEEWTPNDGAFVP